MTPTTSALATLGTSSHRLADGAGALLERVEVLAVDADHEVGRRLGEERGDALGGVGPDLGVDAGIPGDDGTDGVDLLVVVAVRVEAQPQLTGIDIHDLVGQHGTSDVAGDVLDARDRAKLAA